MNSQLQRKGLRSDPLCVRVCVCVHFVYRVCTCVLFALCICVCTAYRVYSVYCLCVRMWVCVCVCVYPACVCACVYCVFVCVFVCAGDECEPTSLPAAHSGRRWAWLLSQRW